MRLFASWLIGTLLAFGALGGGYHLVLEGEPRRVAVIVDSSFPMSGDWRGVPALLRKLGGTRYTDYALLTERIAIHGWQRRLDLGQMQPYGPRDFGRLRAGNLPELAHADRVILVTNAPAAALEGLGDWEVVRP